MKFAIDSLVICLDMLDEKDNLTYTQIIQQIGRSARRRGTSLGHVLIESNESTPVDFKDSERYMEGLRNRTLKTEYIQTFTCLR